jgi:acyl transferase domain-containing protein
VWACWALNGRFRRFPARAVALHVALLAVWRRLGVRPDAVCSFSMGEPSGAVACGALSPRDGAAVMSAMTRCVSAAAAAGGGGMLAVIGLPAAELRCEAAMQPGVEVGAVFGAAGGALTGDRAGLAVAEARLRADARVKMVAWPLVTKVAMGSRVI